MQISVFLPCRLGSQRVPKKNTKPFAKFKHGLLELKLKQLLESKLISKIYLSSNDDFVLDYAKSLNEQKIILHKRNEFLCSNKVSADELVAHALYLIRKDEILWTHVTSPFFEASDYDEAILSYKKALKQGFDSLMSVTALKGFFWDKQTTINYDRKDKKWPPTQDTKPIYEVNSAIFLANANIYKKFKDRIGENPFFYEVDKIKGLDIDYKEDFEMAEMIYNARGGGVEYVEFKIFNLSPLKRSVA